MARPAANDREAHQIHTPFARHTRPSTSLLRLAQNIPPLAHTLSGGRLMLALGTRSSRCFSNTLCRRAFVAHCYSTTPSPSAKNKPSASARKAKASADEPADKWNYNKSSLIAEPVDVSKLRLVTANELEKETVPPTGVKMLVRDFIEDSLYNPNYGYFPKQATIFETDNDSFDFESLRNSIEFQEKVAEKYTGYGSDNYEGPGRQIWHTPTELFKPYYGQAIAQCVVSEYLLKYFPYEDFVIYEIGAGNGTLAMDILNYLQEAYPMVYERTRYNIIEISGSLVKLQKKKLLNAHPCVKITHQSIFHYNKREPSPCYFIAMEVVDNFAHDIIRYDLDTMQPMQGLVTISDEGDFDLVYTPVTDPLVSSLLELRKTLRHDPPVNRLMRSSPILRKIYTSLPFAPNLSKDEFLPTRLLSLMQTLRNNFPRHRLLLSDFSSLPDTIPGINGPVVQTRFRNTTIPCSTLLVKQGYFDIFFPTDFERLRDMYELLLSQPTSRSPSPLASSSGEGETGDETMEPRPNPLMSSGAPPPFGSGFFNSRYPKDRRGLAEGRISGSGLPVGERMSNVFTHAEFLETYADLNKTKLGNGENPMLDFYKNVKFLF